jgi:hypothetical protein
MAGHIRNGEGGIPNENFLLCWTRDGEIPFGPMLFQARRVLVCAARKRTGFQMLYLREVDGRVRASLTIHNAPGGCIRLSPEDAGTNLGASLCLAMVSLGAGRKVQIGRGVQ